MTTAGAVFAAALAIAAYFLVPYLKRHYRTVTVNAAEATAAEKADAVGTVAEWLKTLQ